MKPSLRSGLFLGVILAGTASQAAVERLAFRSSPQKDIVPPTNIVDGTWIIVGNGEKAGARVARDTDQPYKGQPVYRFSAADHSVNRIEFCEVFGTSENLDGLSPVLISNALAVGAAYLNADTGRYGDTVTYEWSTRFPKPMGPQSQGIFAQWHGRPDRTLINDGNALRLLPGAEMVALLKTLEFKEDGWGYDRSTGKRTDCRLDGGAGGPIGAFKIGENHLYLIVRSDASRLSTADHRQKPKPSHEIGHRIKEGVKEASLVWKLPLSQVPVNEWIDFKVRIHYSEYAADDDRALTSGSATVWMNGEQVAHWQGNIGKNDIQGPYFKFGIYKPGETGFEVDHAAYRRTIERTRKSPLVPDPLKQ